MKNNRSIQSVWMTWIIIAILVSACGVAPAPVDGDVVRVLAGTTNWIIDQLGKAVPPVGVEALYNSSKQLLVVGTPFQSGYGFTILNSETFDALDDPAVAKSLCGNYVNCSTWNTFRDWLLQNGWVTQVVAFANTVGHSWFTFGVGLISMPDEFSVYGLPGLPSEGYLEYKQ